MAKWLSSAQWNVGRSHDNRSQAEPKTSFSETWQDTSLLKCRTPCLNKEDCGDSREDKATEGGGTWFLEWLHGKPLLCCEHCTWARSIKIFQVTENLVYLLQQLELAFHKALWDSALWESKNMRVNLSISLTPLHHKKGLENTHTNGMDVRDTGRETNLGEKKQNKTNLWGQEVQGKLEGNEHGLLRVDW